ncbi:MAG: DJ-1/PfpI family protein [Proteobacteria bacterium]|nr:DJ-1/PfpI family protein [Pseudomonadota bacterium]
MKSSLKAAVFPVISTLIAGLMLATPAAARPDPSHKKVAILIFDNVEVIDYSGPLEVLSDAGFDVFTVAATKAPVTTSAGDAVKLTPKYTFADAPQADLIIIPGGGFEAAKDSDTVAWIKRESEHAEHVMSVCNGAFTLANTGLLDGLSATTTAGNINRFRQAYPAIKVAPEQRVIDNGKIITTAGLSAGIDGALHMVDVMKGEGGGRSVALGIEYDWRPNGAYVRGVMADRLIPSPYRILGSLKGGDFVDADIRGDKDRWATTLWYSTTLSPAELSAKLAGGYGAAYALDGGAWAPKSFHAEAAGPLATRIRFDDRDGGHWKGALTVEPVEGEAHQVAIRIAVDRAG